MALELLTIDAVNVERPLAEIDTDGVILCFCSAYIVADYLTVNFIHHGHRAFAAHLFAELRFNQKGTGLQIKIGDKTIGPE